MTAALVITGLLGLVGILILRSQVASARAELAAERKKGDALSEELHRVTAVSVDQGKRMVAVESRYREEIAALDKELASCRDPAVVRERLQRLLGVAT